MIKCMLECMVLFWCTLMNYNLIDPTTDISFQVSEQAMKPMNELHIVVSTLQSLP